MRTGLRLLTTLVVAPALLAVGACDSTVGIDATRPTFTDLLVPGACKISTAPDLSEIDVSVILLDGQNGILPDDKVQRETRPVSELLGRSSFVWERVADRQYMGPEPAVAQGVESGTVAGVDLNTLSAAFRFNGGEDRKSDDRLVLLLMDHSGSLIGKDPFTDEVDLTRASDRRDQRIAFFRQLVGNIPKPMFMSMVSFNESLPNIDAGDNNDGPAVPTRNRDIIQTALDALEREETGGTPIARALRDSKNSIIDGNPDLNPVVVLFTDGVEGGDPNDPDRSALDAAISDYANAKIPVIVLQLQPPLTSGQPQGRDPKLVELACRTGGEYLFIERPEEFTNSRDLGTIVRNRLVGSWIVRAQTTLSAANFGADAYFLSTQLTVSLGAVSTQAERLDRNRDQSLDYLDTRLWFVK